MTGTLVIDDLKILKSKVFEEIEEIERLEKEKGKDKSMNMNVRDSYMERLEQNVTDLARPESLMTSVRSYLNDIQMNSVEQSNLKTVNRGVNSRSKVINTRKFLDQNSNEDVRNQQEQSEINKMSEIDQLYEEINQDVIKKVALRKDATRSKEQTNRCSRISTWSRERSRISRTSCLFNTSLPGSTENLAETSFSEALARPDENVISKLNEITFFNVVSDDLEKAKGRENLSKFDSAVARSKLKRDEMMLKKVADRERVTRSLYL